MGTFRRLALLALIAYAAFAVGMNFHSHPQGKDQLTLHCKLCQASQTSLEQASTSRISPELSNLKFRPAETVAYASSGIEVQFFGRAPPLS